MTQTTGGTGAREAAGSVTNEATERASELKDTAAEHVGAVASEAKEQARNVMDQTRSEVTRQLDEQGRRMGQSVRQASDQLRSMAGNAEPGVVSDITRQLGDGLANVANTVEEGGVQGVAEQLRDLARRQPGLFLAGAGIAGYLTVVLLSFAAAWGLAEAVPIGVAFLIVGIVWGVVGAVLFAAGRARMRDLDMKPEQTIETMQENVQWAKQQKS
jgi:Putative Actinobacterial Holin-X, holin superfamily III